MCVQTSTYGNDSTNNLLVIDTAARKRTSSPFVNSSIQILMHDEAKGVTYAWVANGANDTQVWPQVDHGTCSVPPGLAICMLYDRDSHMMCTHYLCMEPAGYPGHAGLDIWGSHPLAYIPHLHCPAGERRRGSRWVRVHHAVHNHGLQQWLCSVGCDVPR